MFAKFCLQVFLPPPAQVGGVAVDRLCPQRSPELGPGLSLDLPGQGRVAGGGEDGAPPPSREGRQRSAAQAAGGAPGGGPLRGLGGHLGCPLGWGLREAPALGS